ncbi:MAG: hypothetical protein ACK4K7_14980 [Allosphingosinicella sp.]
MTREEEEREQAEFDRKADKASGWLVGCIPVFAVLLLPLALVI